MLLYNHMAIFLAVAQTGSFTKGARKLGVPKSTVSHRISELEDRLGVRLMDRTTRKMRLTSEGELFLSRCEEMESAAQSAQRLVQGLRAVPHGRLRVTCPHSFVSGLMAKVLAEYTVRFPNVTVEVTSTNDWKDLIEDDFDIAIRLGPLEDSTLIARPFFKIETHLLASPDYLAQAGAPKALADIRTHRCIKTAYSPAWRFSSGLTIEEVVPTGVVTVNDLPLAKELALLGVGLAFLPSLYLDGEIDDGRLVRLMPEHEPPQRQMYFVFASRQNQSVNATSFMEIATQCLAQS